MLKIIRKGDEVSCLVVHHDSTVNVVGYPNSFDDNKYVCSRSIINALSMPKVGG